MSKPFPQPRPLPIIGNALRIDPSTPVQSFMALAREYGPIFRLTLPRQNMVVLGSHALVAEACDETRFEKKVFGPLNEVRSFAGDGLFTAHRHEPNWEKAHRILLPALGAHSMRDYFGDMLDVAEQMLLKWERLGPDQPVDVADNMTRLTLDTIALSGFGYRFNSFYKDQMHPFVDAMIGALQEAGDRGRRLPLQSRLMLGTKRKYQRDTALMHEVTGTLIKKRRAEGIVEKDLLGLMLHAKDPITGEGLSDENIVYQLVTFLIAGHETTSGLLSFAIHLLLANPQILRKAREHVDEVLADEQPRFEHIAKLKYLDRILRETLRLYPTAPAFAVMPKETTTLGDGYRVEKGETILMLLPIVHRDPAVWKDPDHFDPDRFEHAPPTHAWKPFGNGERACIGRAFAMQEAVLVLAMVLQRFDITLAAPYDLKIKETLTLKPDNLRLLAKVRKQVRVAAAPVAPSPLAAPVKTNGGSLLALFGSNSGASEAFARRIASDADARGFSVDVGSLDDHVDSLGGQTVVIVTASYNGKPPDNAARFLEWLRTKPKLDGVRFVVFGCGNRDWDATYQAVPAEMDALLEAAGATRLMPRGEADAREDFFGDFERWYQSFWPALGGGAVVSDAPLYSVQVVKAVSEELVQKHKLALGTVLAVKELAPQGRSKRHIEVQLPEGMRYRAGDYLAVLPENDPALVARAAKRFGADLDSTIVIDSPRGAKLASLPLGTPISVRTLLARHVELTQPASPRDLERLAGKNPCPPHKVHLQQLAVSGDNKKTVLELCEQYESCLLSLADFIELLPAMRLRSYSIASSPLVAPNLAALTVSAGFGGACSTYLSRLQAGDRIAVTVRSPNQPFHPPADNRVPMILVGAGSGIAPLRGFLQDRAAREQPGETLLFFGCDDPKVDFLYEGELRAFPFLKLLPTFCKAPERDLLFVQHRIAEEAKHIEALISEGAHVYVCGDSQRLAPAVKAELAKIADVAALAREGRFVVDVF